MMMMVSMHKTPIILKRPISIFTLIYSFGVDLIFGSYSYKFVSKLDECWLLANLKKTEGGFF